MGHAFLRSLIGVALVLLATSVAAQSGSPITLRIGDHPTYSRLVFDFVSIPGYEIELDGNRLKLDFADRLDIESANLANAPLDRIAAPDIRQSGNRTIAVFTVPSGMRLRHFTSGSSLVVDVMDGGAGPADATPETPPVQQSAQRRIEAAAESSAETSRPPDAIEETADPEQVTVTFERDGEDGILRYAWPTLTPAAVFIRAGYLWVIFEHARPVSHAALDFSMGSAAGALIGPPERFAPDWATVLRYRLRRSLSVTAMREDAGWDIRLSNRPRLPREVIAPARSDGASGPGLFLPAADAGSRMTVADPAVGDDMDVVPLGDSGRGLPENGEYVEFSLLATAQGISVLRRSEDVTVRRFTDGVGIFSENGLALSATSMSGDGRGGVLLDMANWRRGGIEAFVENEQALRVALSLASDTELRAARWALARFYLGHGLDAEALGILDLMRARDPSMAGRRDWKAAYGVALLGLSRPDEALGQLLDAELDSEGDVWLWRALAAEETGKNEDALLYFERGVDALDFVDQLFQIRLRLAMARAALARQSHDVADSHLHALRDLRPESPVALAAADFLTGHLAETRGDFPEARAAYRRAAEGPSRRTSAQARFALAMLERREGLITPADTIRRLEQLRFAWRGDALESRMLGELARLYVDENRYREGLELFRMATANINDSGTARYFTSAMSDIFARLFLEGEADSLSPVAALSLFYDFQELTPLGARGDRMIRKLSDRLVAVGLLGRAADLLRHQVEFRLDGVAQSQVAAELARIYLADSRPQAAINIMRSTRSLSLPEDVLNLRNLIEARALAELSRYEEAIALLQDDTSAAADLLRADIYWSDRNWPRLASITARILESRTQSDAPLGLAGRQHVLRRAIALSFMEDANGLRRLRTRYGEQMQSGEMARIFNTLTSPTPPAAGELSRIAGQLAGLNEFRSFISAYQDEFTPGALEAAGGV